MAYFQDTDGRVFFFEAEPERKFIRETLVLIKDQDAEAILTRQAADRPVIVDEVKDALHAVLKGEVKDALHAVLKGELMRTGKTDIEADTLLKGSHLTSFAALDLKENVNVETNMARVVQ